MKWQAPTHGEREPNYSGRVLVPRLRHLLSLEPGLSAVVKGDGSSQQNCDPVWIAGRRLVPDITVDASGKGKMAFEVKLFSGKSHALKEALGQALLYLSGNYDSVRVVFVSTTGGTHFSSGELDRLNAAFPDQLISCVELTK
jgi:hypothetical protein